MITTSQLSANQAAYRSLKPDIDQRYPRGRFVAIHEAQVVADAATFQELDGWLNTKGFTSRDIIVVQAGVHYPEHAVILTQDTLE